MNSTEELLKALTEAHGVSGFEAPIRGVLRDLFTPLGEVEQDKMGNLICRQGDDEDAPKVMLAGHMDEIGFMVKHVTKDGYIKFLQLGGWWDQVLLGHRVIIKTRKGDISGIIGAKPIHLLPPDERKKVVEKKDMVIDVGCSTADQVEELGVRVGDSIVPKADFEVLANGDTFLSKAFDDRIGCALVVEALRHFNKNKNPNTLYGVATVQEEVGLRGARTSVNTVEPDVAIILESGIAGDVPGIKPEQSAVKLGKGPVFLVFDASMIPNPLFRDFVIDVAEEMEIPIQLTTMDRGGTDGGAIHINRTGVPTVVLAVAARHIHSHGGIIHREDYESTVKLLCGVIERLDAETIASFTK